MKFTAVDARRMATAVDQRRIARGHKSAESDGSADLKPEWTNLRDRGEVCRGNLVVTAPRGDLVLQGVCFDSGSTADAVSVSLAKRLQKLGVSWGESGGRLVVANGEEVRPEGELRLLLTVDPAREGTAVPRSVTFATDVEIVPGLTSELIIGWPTMVGTGLLPIVFGLETFEFETQQDDQPDEVDALWPTEYEDCQPTYHCDGSPESVYRLGRVKELVAKYWDQVFTPPPPGGSKLPPLDVELKKVDGEEMQPQRQRARIVSPWIRDLIREDTEMRLEKGWYRKPEPGELIPYASPIVAAKQPQKGPNVRRICLDLTQVNRCAVETRHPVKNQKEVTRRLAGSRFFDQLDLIKGYHQVKLTERAAKLMAVATPDGIVIPVTCPFGFHGLPSYFQHLMSDVVFEGLEGYGLETFIDDIVNHSNEVERSLYQLEECFKRAAKWDLRFNPKKCSFNAGKAIFLGHEVDGEGHRHTAKRIEGLEAMERPHDSKQLKSFLGLANYFCEHLGMNYSDVSSPLHHLTKKNVQWQWTEKEQAAFEEIKRRIVANPKLYFLDYDHPIYVRCDASKSGCGAQLFQVINGKEHPVSYISKSFTPAERNWSTLEQELYAAVWSVKRWKDMLEGHPFIVMTDHKNILQLSKSEVPKIVRWRLMLQQFNFSIMHVAGNDSKHVVADCLSRLHGPAHQSTLSCNAVLRSATHNNRKEGSLEGSRLVKPAQSASPDSLDDPASVAVSLPARPGPRLISETTGIEDHAEKTVNEPSSQELRATVPGKSTSTSTPSTKRGRAGQPKLELTKKKVRTTTHKESKRILRQDLLESVVLSEEVKKAIDTVHNSVVGHMGEKRTRAKLQQLFAQELIPVMPTVQQIARYIQLCPYCQKMEAEKLKESKAAVVQRSTLTTKGPMEEVSIDVIGPLPTTDDDNEFIMVAVDGFSKFVFAEPCKDTTAETAANFLHKLGGMVGWPKAVRWDNCPQFDNHLIRVLTDLIGVERHESIPFNPETNGVVERCIKEIIRHLRFIVNERRIKEDWIKALPMVLRILNSQKQAGIGLSPAEIIFPGLDLDAGVYPTNFEVVKPSIEQIPEKGRRQAVEKWVRHLQQVQAQAIKLALRRAEAAVMEKVQSQSEDEGTFQSFSVGEYVVTRWRGGKPTKLSCNFRGPYEVVERKSGSLYVLRDPADDKLYQRAAGELYKYHVDGTTNLVDVIAMDEFEMIIDKILQASRPENSRKVSDYDFLVHFKNTDNSEDVWLPYAEMTRKGGGEVFWDFVAANPQLGIRHRT